MSRPLAPSTSVNNAAPLQRIVNWTADLVGISSNSPATQNHNSKKDSGHALINSTSNSTSNSNTVNHNGKASKMPASKSKLAVAPAVPTATANVNAEEFVRTRDAFITALTGLTSSLDKFVKAYLEHSEAVVENGGTLDIGPAFAPLSRLLPGAFHPAPSAFTPVNAVETLPSGVDELEVDADGKKKKRKRVSKPRDPNAPKRPMTAYFRFMQEQRPLLTEEFKNEPVGEDGAKRDVNKLATERWKELSEREREHYHASYRKERQEYEQAMKALGLPVGKADMHEGEAEHADEPIIPAITAASTTIPVVSAVTDDNDEDNDESDDEQPAQVAAPLPPPPPPAAAAKTKASKASNPESAKKTPRQSAKKKAKDATETTTPQVSSINPSKSVAAAAADAPASSPLRKRKAAKAEAEPAPKKRGRKSLADADAAAASAQLEQEQPASESVKGKKEKKSRKRKSEAAD